MFGCHNLIDMEKYGVSQEALQLLLMLSKQNELYTQRNLMQNQNIHLPNYSFIQNNNFGMGAINHLENQILQLISNPPKNILNLNQSSNLASSKESNKNSIETQPEKKSSSEEKNTICSEVKSNFVKEDLTQKEKVENSSIFFFT